MNDGFYRAFEERYRGSRELIKGRLAVYFPFVEPLLEIPQSVQAVDLGCGRGEWLELLSEWGFQPVGVDLDAGMLASCHELGLKVEQGDAIDYLRALPAESQAIVSAFHLVEHLPFDDLRTVVSEAMRVLKPGGLLIMETPNPENLVVATRNFYLDPTHQRPIPSELLTFVAENAGFFRIKKLGLQEPKDLAGKAAITLADVFHGTSPDYAIVAQKQADLAELVLFDGAFAREYGLSQDELLGRLDSRLHSQMQQTESKAQQAESKAQQAESKAQQAESKAQQAESKAQQAEDASKQAWAQLDAVYASTSWRVTSPLRRIGRAVLWLRGKAARTGFGMGTAKSFLRRALVFMLKLGVSHARKSSRFRRFVLRILNRTPALAVKLRQIHIVSQLSPHPHHVEWSASPVHARANHAEAQDDAHASRQSSIPMPDGINARQRTPLETNFHVYGGGK